MKEQYQKVAYIGLRNMGVQKTRKQWSGIL